MESGTTLSPWAKGRDFLTTAQAIAERYGAHRGNNCQSTSVINSDNVHDPLQVVTACTLYRTSFTVVIIIIIIYYYYYINIIIYLNIKETGHVL